MIADNAIKGRYHVFTTVPMEVGSNNGFGYTIYEDGEFQEKHGWNLPEDADSTILSLAEFYESVRRLDRFDPNHCPILEVQTVGSDHYFLQYHRGRDTELSTFTLEREPEEDEVEAVFVRGATLPEGLTATINIRWSPATKQLSDEEGGLDLHWDMIYQELMARRRKVQIERLVNFADISAHANNAHLRKSKLFKPGLSIVIYNPARDENPLLRGILDDNKEEGFFDKPHPILVHAISDGRKGYLRRVDL